MCLSDSLTVDGQWPGLSFPRGPGHEIAGAIDVLGDGVVGWRLASVSPSDGLAGIAIRAGAAG